MEEEELKYILRLLDGVNVDLYEEIIQLFYDTIESKPTKGLSEDILQFISINLKTNPVTTTTLISFFKTHFQHDEIQLKNIHELYLNALQDQLTNPEGIDIDIFISLLSVLQFNEKYIPDLINKIIKHLPKDILMQYKKQILISLIGQQNPELLSACSNLVQHDNDETFHLTPENMIHLCYQEKTHWLLKAAEVYKNQIHDMKSFTFKFNNFRIQILVMVLIDIMNNQENTDLPLLVQQLNNIFPILNNYDLGDKELQFYAMEVKRELSILHFCLENNCKLSSASIFSQILSQSALAVLSQVCRLPKLDRYKVSRLLSTNNDFLNDLLSITGVQDSSVVKPSISWDVVVYNSYCALTSTIDVILDYSGDLENVREITKSLEDMKRLVASIQPLDFSIEIIENVFTCLFLRYEHFSNDDDVQDFPCGAHSDSSYLFSKKQRKNLVLFDKKSSAGFICSSVTTQMILNTLKSCVEALEEKSKDIDSESGLMKRLKTISRMVNHALWKYQLVSTLSPETAPIPKLCLDYIEFAETSEDEDYDTDYRVSKRKSRVKRRHTNPKSDCDQVMLTSSISVNSVGSSTPTMSTIEFISIMLAKPNCLVALALYHNDFVKANQIIEMFDLADGEIATEVLFTEKYRQLVAKIKNILYYKDDTRYPTKELSTLSVISTEVMGLVEGFLSSNRSPNSLEIMELATRHTHLQLYNHQNAPFINAVDILLSSGLNREITYALINVVERKLAEVRTSTDVAAVKKTNYIRFVEDIASVTFEILGNTEKAFEFVDNVCGIVNNCRVPIKHKEFIKLNQLSKDLKKSCKDLDEIVNPETLASVDVSLIQKYHQTYMNVVAASDKDVCNIGEVCHKKSRVHYLRMCYMYCKTVAQLDENKESVTEPSYFSILEKPLPDIIGNLVINKSVGINTLEPICKKLNINLIHKIILNCCPPITLANPQKEATEVIFNNLLQIVYDFKNTEENLFLEPTVDFAPMPQIENQQCLTYIVLNNWVLAHIVKKIHTASNDNTLQQSFDARTKYINNYMDLERFFYLKCLFANNRYLASLHTTIDLNKLFAFMPKLIELGKISKCLLIIDSLSEHQLLCSANLMNLRDLILFKLAIHANIDGNWKYCQHLKCPELKVNLILNNLNCWPMEGAMEVLQYMKFFLDQVALDEGLYEKCNFWMTRIPLYDQIASIMGKSTWYNIYEKSIESSEDVIEVLMDSQQFKLCLEWADLHDVTENMKCLIIINLLRQLFEYTSQATPKMIKELLSRLSVTQALDLISDEKSKIRSVELLKVCVEYVTEHSSDWRSFENIKIGLQIMLEIDVNLRPLFWDLIEHPLLMLEQFLMNAKLDILTNIINKISNNLKNDPSGDNLYYNIKTIESLVISRNSVDALLRFYAEKALDMKNPRNSYTPPPKPSEDSLLQSIDSINIENATRPFIMPEQVPSKQDWVKDYSTDRCMLCQTSIFSMIIRRHHCRRCGRLVCHACSRNKMQVPTYPPGIKFRVCDNCHSQTMNKKSGSERDNAMLSSNSDSAGSGVTCMDWCLSNNSKRNEDVRNEFSYEFIPNVTLCLSIMKMHSINLDYPRFLLDRSDEVAREVCRSSDARLLVRARRSLLLAAAELYSRTPANRNADESWARVSEAGSAHVARCLSLSAALTTLVQHAEHRKLHIDPAHNSHIVRSLLEAEQWDLALEIATKSGLSRTSVLAAWGKTCLKAGCFKQAREKFAHCFKSSLQISTYYDGNEECEYGKEASEMSPYVYKRVHTLRHSDRSSSVSSLQSDGRPRSNPPLLNEIINILEELNYPVNPQLLSKAESIKATNEKLSSMNTSKKRIPVIEPALNIMHMLASVKKIKNGDYSDFQTTPMQPKKSMAQTLLRRNHHEPKIENQFKKLDPFFYKECVYYLTNYGSHVANICFYLKHSNLSEVLNYCYDNLVDKDAFTETVYMDCLKRDKVNDLIQCMSDMDHTLETWGEYITQICRTLEMSGKLDALYSIQCASGQQARAAATCARLYCKPTPRNTSQRTLLSRNKHLAAAIVHLQHTTPVTQKTNDPKSFHLQLDKSTIDKHLTTISRQIEVVKFLAECEAKERLTDKVMCDVMPGVPLDDEKSKDIRPYTLFGSNADRMRLVAAVLVSGMTVAEGFQLAFKIITEYRLDSMKIYNCVALYLVQVDRFLEVKTLSRCVRDSGETAASLMSDQILESGVRAVVKRCASRGQLHDEQAEILIEEIHSISVKISCYLECRILSSAYILAVRHERDADLRRILHEAEKLQNDQIRFACLKRLSSKTNM